MKENYLPSFSWGIKIGLMNWVIPWQKYVDKTNKNSCVLGLESNMRFTRVSADSWKLKVMSTPFWPISTTVSTMDGRSMIPPLSPVPIILFRIILGPIYWGCQLWQDIKIPWWIASQGKQIRRLEKENRVQPCSSTDQRQLQLNSKRQYLCFYWILLTNLRSLRTIRTNILSFCRTDENWRIKICYCSCWYGQTRIN